MNKLNYGFFIVGNRRPYEDGPNRLWVTYMYDECFHDSQSKDEYKINKNKSYCFQTRAASDQHRLSRVYLRLLVTFVQDDAGTISTGS